MPADTDVTTIDEDEPVDEDTLAEDTDVETTEDTVVDEPDLDERPREDDLDEDDLEVSEDVATDDDAVEDEAVDEGAAVVPPKRQKVSRRQHRADMKASARRVRRVVRRIDTWSVFKVASLFIACVWGIVVLASLLIWRAAVTSGSVENTEDFIIDLGFEDFNFDPQQMFESLLSVGAVMAVAAIFFTVLLTVLFNLICDITGGVRVTMIEQDLADTRKRRRRKTSTD